MHGKAKEQAEIDGEKEIVETATIQAMGKNKYGNITQNELEEKLNSNAGDGKTEVIDDGENFVVKFIESNRYYKVDNDGNVEYFEVIVDEHPGNIKVGIKGEELTGTKERPFEIWCIEDLVEWSQNYTEYINSYIKLGRTLNFNSNLSYTDGKVLNCSSVDELRELLTNNSGSGFTPISTFNGNFDGQGYEIRNIYINSQLKNVALIGSNGNSETCIKNLGITGSITGVMNVGGIVAEARKNVLIQNCYNKCNIYYPVSHSGVAIYGVGGILGYAGATTTNILISDCYNLGKINSEEKNGYVGIGGIVGSNYGYSTVKINNCYNMGEIYNAGNFSAGIIGYGGLYIYNSYNVGRVYGSGLTRHTSCKIVNCFNSRKVKYGISNDDFNQGTIEIYNTYNIGEFEETPTYKTGWYTIHELENLFYVEGTADGANGEAISMDLIKSNGETDTEDSKALISLLNDYVTKYNELHCNEDDFIKLNKWILGENGYPIFE